MYRDHGAEASFLSRPANAAGGSLQRIQRQAR
jgi:hypothetical protein